MFDFGEPDVLKLIEKAVPSFEEDEVIVKLKFAGVNPADAYIRQGGYAFFNPKLPYTPGFDGAGIITEVGSKVTNYQVGDRVFVSASLGKKATGTYAEYISCSTDAIRQLPETVTFEEGAALGIPGTAAYRALFQRGGLKQGEKVLIHGASGGVGTLAVQMAKEAGAYVIGTAGSEDNCQIVRENGADLVVNHNQVGYTDNIPQVDLVLEMLANINLEKDLELLNQRGRVVIIGNRGSLDFNPRLTMAKEADIYGIAIWNATAAERAESLDAIETYLKQGILSPAIGDLYPLKEAAQAQYDIIHLPAKGKILLII